VGKEEHQQLPVHLLIMVVVAEVQVTILETLETAKAGAQQPTVVAEAEPEDTIQLDNRADQVL
jgi:hypothetical protein